jgi:CheY-like chemotaxis protein
MRMSWGLEPGSVSDVELAVGGGAAGQVNAPEQADQAAPHGKRILVIDDEPGIAGVLTEVLQLDGHIVEAVGNGVAALDKLQARRYDLILSDIRMPELSGPDFYREVERQHPTLVRHVLFLTGDLMSAETKCFLEQTAVPYLSKPFTLETIRQAVRCALMGDDTPTLSQSQAGE